jgi:hypothetical protein
MTCSEHFYTLLQGIDVDEGVEAALSPRPEIAPLVRIFNGSSAVDISDAATEVLLEKMGTLDEEGLLEETLEEVL